MHKRIFVFGASITYGAVDPNGGWVAYLRQFLENRDNKLGDYENYQTYNLGISADTTNDIINRFENEIQARSIHSRREKVIIFAGGTNDARYLAKEKKLTVSDQQTQQNIQKLIELAKKHTDKIVFLGICGVIEGKTTPVAWDNNHYYYNKDIKNKELIIQKVCLDNNIHFIPIFDQISKLDKNKLFPDGLHPNTQDHRLMFKIIKNYLIKEKII